MKPYAAFLMLHKWQVELTPVVLVGSLMPAFPLRRLVAVVTRGGAWRVRTTRLQSGDSLNGERNNFLASDWDFNFFNPANCPWRSKHLYKSHPRKEWCSC
jgi:hypothetical protein